MNYRLRFILSNNNIQMLSMFHRTSHILYNSFELIFTQINFVHKYDTTCLHLRKLNQNSLQKTMKLMYVLFL